MLSTVWRVAGQSAAPCQGDCPWPTLAARQRLSAGAQPDPVPLLPLTPPTRELPPSRESAVIMTSVLIWSQARKVRSLAKNLWAAVLRQEGWH